MLDAKPSGPDQEVTVMFKNLGTKRLLASMAKLERSKGSPALPALAFTIGDPGQLSRGRLRPGRAWG